MDFALAQRILNTLQAETISRRFPGRLDRMRLFLRELGDPQTSFPSIHVGGTAGKGSTATMIAAILTAGGFKAGLHTKPHLRSVTERARIDGSAISEDRFAQVMSDMLPAIEALEHSEFGPPSYFELLVGLAFLYFKQERVDVAVVEVGIGGTLDGTNVLEPIATVLTNVGLDHTDVLGNTLELIAADKAGIIKPRTPVVTAADGAALEIFRAIAQREGAPFARMQDVVHIEHLPTETPYGQHFSVTTPRRSYDVRIPLMGEFQVRNAATAIVACEATEDRFPISTASVERGLAGVSLPGRMEFYPSRPSLLFDVAHNGEKAAALADALAQHFPERRFVFVVAISESKDAAAMLEAWSRLPGQFIFTSFAVTHREPMPPHILAALAETNGLIGRAVSDPIEALSVARRVAGPDDLVVVTGSTFLVATLLEWSLENAGAGWHARV
jgi:dihydrofolate synthase / folylpolyglutamate synthase